MVEEGVASAADIDRALELGYGHRMGPLKTSDLVGLDVRLSIAETLAAELPAERFEPPEILKTLVAEGRTGKKAGRGVLPVGRRSCRAEGGARRGARAEAMSDSSGAAIESRGGGGSASASPWWRSASTSCSSARSTFTGPRRSCS